MYKKEKSKEPSGMTTNLEILQQPPRFVVLDKWYYIELNLMKNTSFNIEEEACKSVRNKDPLYLIDVHLSILDKCVSYQCTTSEKQKESPLTLTVDPSLPIRIPCRDENSRTKIKFKITCTGPTSNFFDSSVTIALHPKYLPDSHDADTTENIKLQSIKTREFKLAECYLHVEAKEWDDIWHKDEGGRDKCMRVSVSLRDNKNNVIKKRKMPLKFTLLYENDQLIKVMQQGILHVFGKTKHEINQITGNTPVRFRIEDVSKNHQGQKFLVQVEDDSRKYSGVAPAFTPSVVVRSKRNKRPRTTKSERSSEGPTKRAPSSRSPFSSDDSQVLLDLTSKNAVVVGNREVQKLREAMKGVIEWTEEVVNGLYPLQRQIVGHTYHNMPNPNGQISKILSMYAESTREHLGVLISAVENTRPEQDTRKQEYYGMTEIIPTENQVIAAEKSAHDIRHTDFLYVGSNSLKIDPQRTADTLQTVGTAPYMASNKSQTTHSTMTDSRRLAIQPDFEPLVEESMTMASFPAQAINQNMVSTSRDTNAEVENSAARENNAETAMILASQWNTFLGNFLKNL